MKDRIPTKPGRVLITPEGGGAPYYATMTMADEPVELGDAPVKANLLPDDVAASLGLTGNPQVKDAFLALQPQIGDTLATLRGDLSTDWALCNGAPIDGTLYPELAAITEPNLLYPWVTVPEWTTSEAWECIDRRGYMYSATYNAPAKTLTLLYTKDGVSFLTKVIPNFSPPGTVIGMEMDNSDRVVVFSYTQQASPWLATIYATHIGWDGENVVGDWVATTCFAGAQYFRSPFRTVYNPERGAYFLVVGQGQGVVTGFKIYKIAESNFAGTEIYSTSYGDASFSIVEFRVLGDSIGLTGIWSSDGTLAIYISRNNGVSFTKYPSSAGYGQPMRLIIDVENNYIGYCHKQNNDLYVNHLGANALTVLSSDVAYKILPYCFTSDGNVYAMDTSGDPWVLYSCTFSKTGSTLNISIKLVGALPDKSITQLNTAGAPNLVFDGNGFKKTNNKGFLPKRLPIAAGAPLRTYIKVKEA